MGLPKFIEDMLKNRSLRIYALQNEIDNIKTDLLVPPSGVSRIKGWRENMELKLQDKEEQLRRLQSER